MFSASVGPMNKEQQENSKMEESDIPDYNGSSKRGPASPRARTVNLTKLVQEKILEPGQGVLTIDYLGQKYMADLLDNGKILYAGMQFASPSSWAIYVKKQVNPSKKSGCGWNSVKYRGKKLDIFKSIYNKKKSPLQSIVQGQSPGQSTEDDNSQGSNIFNVDMLGNPQRLPIKYSKLKEFIGEIDPNVLVECVNFDEYPGNMQPFVVTISTNCLLLINFHCHLTTGEVVGYMGGKWDPEKQCLSILQAFPCKCRLGDRENAAVAEEQIRLGMQSRGLSKVGWYHSHPSCAAEPTLRDIDCQMQYQMKFSANNPVLALICTPSSDHSDHNTDSVLNAFWVAPPIEQTISPNACYGIPMRFSYSYIKDNSITPDLHQELTWLVDYYKLAPDLISMSAFWKSNMTYLDRLKFSTLPLLPQDKNKGYIIELIQKLIKTPQ
uniref:MPN domain-containing protein-like n=1 Tax=Styela clava TaxID=7725 RepID=UPI00193ADBB9|nr:MPN domain-containing protein-like [Styela clava]